MIAWMVRRLLRPFGGGGEPPPATVINRVYFTLPISRSAGFSLPIKKSHNCQLPITRTVTFTED